jgi:hypothetical protein
MLRIMRCEKGFKKLIGRRCEAAKKFRLQLAAFAIAPGVLDVHSEEFLLAHLLFFCVRKNSICKSIDEELYILPRSAYN